MLVIKVGGSTFAPKNNDTFDTEYLLKLKLLIDKYFLKEVMLLHGTGNVGHGFVQRYGISQKTWYKFAINRDRFFGKIDSIFTGYERISGEKILLEGKSRIEGKSKIISGGDAWENSYEIIGSDELFGELIFGENNGLHIVLTDVDGVFDSKGNIIPILKLSEIDTIPFWQKEGDVTNGMKGKLEALKKYIHPQSQGVWICNGFDLENLEEIFLTGNGKGTFVLP